MHKKNPKICTGCRVSAAKIYLHHSSKIAKARPHSVGISLKLWKPLNLKFFENPFITVLVSMSVSISIVSSIFQTLSMVEISVEGTYVQRCNVCVFHGKMLFDYRAQR